MAAGDAFSSFCFVLFLQAGLYTTRRQINGKIRYVAKKYVVNVCKICFHLVVFLYWSMTALLGPRFLKMKYCSFATCVCY